jgi:hypothetical protein
MGFSLNPSGDLGWMLKKVGGTPTENEIEN